jgi:hypothetical protein
VLYLVLGVALAVLLVWVGRRGPRLQRAHMRLAAGAAAAVTFTAAGFAAVRGAWLGALVLAGLAAFFAPLTRSPQTPRDRGAAEMSLEEARSILGVGPDATREEIQAAYRRLMRMAHPDQGGTSGLAAKLNAARDRLMA